MFAYKYYLKNKLKIAKKKRRRNVMSLDFKKLIGEKSNLVHIFFIMFLELPSFPILLTLFLFVFMVLVNVLRRRAKTISSASKLLPGTMETAFSRKFAPTFRVFKSWPSFYDGSFISRVCQRSLHLGPGMCFHRSCYMIALISPFSIR